MATMPLLKCATPASAYPRRTFLLFSSASIARTKHAPESPESGLASRSRGGLRKRIARRSLSRVSLGRVRLLKFAFHYTRRFLALFPPSHEKKIKHEYDSQDPTVVQRRKTQTAYLALIYGVSAAQISRI